MHIQHASVNYKSLFMASNLYHKLHNVEGKWWQNPDPKFQARLRRMYAFSNHRKNIVVNSFTLNLFWILKTSELFSISNGQKWSNRKKELIEKPLWELDEKLHQDNSMMIKKLY